MFNWRRILILVSMNFFMLVYTSIIALLLAVPLTAVFHPSSQVPTAPSPFLPPSPSGSCRASNHLERPSPGLLTKPRCRRRSCGWWADTPSTTAPSRWSSSKPLFQSVILWSAIGKNLFVTVWGSHQHGVGSGDAGRCSVFLLFIRWTLSTILWTSKPFFK